MNVFAARNKELWNSIEARMKDFEETSKTDMAGAVQKLYSEKYKGICPTGETLGKDAAAKYLAENFSDAQVRIDEVSGEGEFAYVRGTFKSGKGNGKYITVWKREADSKLFVYNECWNYSK